MPKFYVYNNASRTLRSGKYRYSFDVIGPFGGGWKGVLRLDDEAQISELNTFALKLGVVEITEDEYNELLKKKLNLKPSSPDVLRQPVTPSPGLVDRAVRVKDPSARTTPEVASAEKAGKPTFEEAVVIGTAPYIDPLEQRSNKKRVKKKAE